jgi:hypothetical protein
MMNRRVFLGNVLSAVALSQTKAARAAEQKAIAQTSEPLVWPVITRPQTALRSFAGHTNTVLDIAGRIGTPPSLVIFSEGNHLMVLLSEDILGAFPAWAKAQPQYADLNVDNVVMVTMPQPIVVQMIRTGGIGLGNLTLDVSRASGLYPDIVMGGPAPLGELRKLGVLEPQARYFYSSRCSRDARPWLCGRGPHAVPPHFILGTDIPRSFRTGTHSGSRAVSRQDRLWPHH